jgi:hypothetical protein
VLATDPDVGQALAFSLSPTDRGAAITPAGRFTWTPAEGQGPGVHVFTVTVTDNGAPALATDAQFSVTVREVNQRPTLAAIPDQAATVGQPLAVNLAVADADLPAQALALDFAAGAPAGAALDQAARRFTWAPAAAQAGEHTVTVRVTDDGAPALGVSRTFRITVGPAGGPPPAQLAAPVLLPGGLVRLAWSSEPGRRYRVEHRDALGAGAWTADGADATAAGATMSRDVAAGAAGQRWFRIVTLP